MQVLGQTEESLILATTTFRLDIVVVESSEFLLCSHYFRL